MDAPLLAVAAQARLVQAIAQSVEDVALHDVADRYGDRLAGVGNLSATDQAVGRCHGHGAHEVVPEVLCNLQGDGLCHCLEVNLDGQGVEQCWLLAARKLHVDDRADNSHDAARNSRFSGLLNLVCCSHT